MPPRKKQKKTTKKKQKKQGRARTRSEGPGAKDQGTVLGLLRFKIELPAFFVHPFLFGLLLRKPHAYIANGHCRGFITHSTPIKPPPPSLLQNPTQPPRGYSKICYQFLVLFFLNISFFDRWFLQLELSLAM